MERNCAVCGKSINGVFVPIDSKVLSSRWNEFGFRISIKNDSIFSSSDITRFGATNLAYPCLSDECSACVCVNCRATLKLEKRQIKTLIPFVKVKIEGGICPTCNGLFDVVNYEHPNVNTQEGFVLIEGRFPPEITCTDLDIDMHPIGFVLDISRLKIPVHVCAFCMSSAVEKTHETTQYVYSKSQPGKQIAITSKYPLCGPCGAIFSDERIKVAPYEIKQIDEVAFGINDIFELRFANPKYGELFLKENVLIFPNIETIKKYAMALLSGTVDKKLIDELINTPFKGQGLSASPDKCMECGKLPGSSSTFSYRCPDCQTIIQVSQSDIPPSHGLYIKCPFCSSTLHIPNTVWCSRCHVSLISENEILEKIAQENDININRLSFK